MAVTVLADEAMGGITMTKARGQVLQTRFGFAIVRVLLLQRTKS
jgi:hypothetical protein